MWGGFVTCRPDHACVVPQGNRGPSITAFGQLVMRQPSLSCHRHESYSALHFSRYAMAALCSRPFSIKCRPPLQLGHNSPRRHLGQPGLFLQHSWLWSSYGYSNMRLQIAHLFFCLCNRGLIRAIRRRKFRSLKYERGFAFLHFRLLAALQILQQTPLPTEPSPRGIALLTLRGCPQTKVLRTPFTVLHSHYRPLAIGILDNVAP